MASLIDTNPHLRNPEERRRLLERNAYDSSVFEGARGLTPASPPVPPAKASRSRPSASKKKAAGSD